MSLGANIQGGDQLKIALARLGKTTQTQLRVGILENATNAEGESVAGYAIKNEFGSRKDNIPPRPFMRWTIKKYSREWAKGVADALHYTNLDYEKVLRLMGETVKGQLMTTIAEWKTPPNSAETEERKGFNKPLVDTGDMKNSIDYEVTK